MAVAGHISVISAAGPEGRRRVSVKVPTCYFGGSSQPRTLHERPFPVNQTERPRGAHNLSPVPFGAAQSSKGTATSAQLALRKDSDSCRGDMADEKDAADTKPDPRRAFPPRERARPRCRVLGDYT